MRLCILNKNMKLILKENKEKELTVTIEYPQKNEEVEYLIRKLNEKEHVLTGVESEREYRISVFQIYYIESVDKKVFIYTKNNVYKSEKRLYQLEEELKNYHFVKVNKSCLLNIKVLLSLKNILNSRLEAELINGEKILVSRTYIENVKKEVLREGRN